MVDLGTMKTCPQCKTAKPLSEFNRNRCKPDGHAYECRLCHRKRCKGGHYQRKYYYTHLDKEKLRFKKRWSDPENRRQHRARVKGTPQGLARVALRNAVQAGSIVKPNFCERCNTVLAKSRIHGHHHDYTQPFNVQWLCSACHAVVHHALKATE